MSQVVLDTWEYVRWSGTGSFYGRNVWSDGISVYMSDGTSSQYVKDPNSNTWTAKSWTGINAQSLYGQNVWFDGTNYYSGNGATQYKLVKGTSTWVDAWTGEYYAGRYVWSDGTNYYYSDNETEPGQYVWDKSTETWKSITWTGLTSFSGQYVWNCNGTTYYSYGSNHYRLNKETHEWTRITWNGLSSFYGIDVWTDGVTVYYSNNSTQYKLNTTTLTWTAFTWDGYNSVVGRDIWTDGTTWYYSSKSIQYYATGTTPVSTGTVYRYHSNTGWIKEGYVYEHKNGAWTIGSGSHLILDTWLVQTWGERYPIYGMNVWYDGDTAYYPGSCSFI